MQASAISPADADDNNIAQAAVAAAISRILMNKTPVGFSPFLIEPGAAKRNATFGQIDTNAPAGADQTL